MTVPGEGMGAKKASAGEYHSFLVRLWYRPEGQEDGSPWQGELHYLQRGRVYPLDDLGDLIDLILKALGYSPHQPDTPKG